MSFVVTEKALTSYSKFRIILHKVHFWARCILFQHDGSLVTNYQVWIWQKLTIKTCKSKTGKGWVWELQELRTFFLAVFFNIINERYRFITIFFLYLRECKKKQSYTRHIHPLFIFLNDSISSIRIDIVRKPYICLNLYTWPRHFKLPTNSWLQWITSKVSKELLIKWNNGWTWCWSMFQNLLYFSSLFWQNTQKIGLWWL